jgi:hypothetical protein
MKPTALFLLLFISAAVNAQTKTTSVSKSVNDDDKTLSVKIHYVADDKKVDYENSFNVEGWTKAQKEALVRRITDSLGVTKRKIVRL